MVVRGMSSILKDPVWKHMRRTVHLVDQDATVSRVARVMREEGVGSVIVLGGAKAVGIITQRDIINKVVAEGRNPEVVKVSEIMSSPLITVEKDETVAGALELMEKKNIRRVVVVDEKGKPLGISVELRICGDLLNKQIRPREAKAQSWLGQYIMEVTEHQLEHAPEFGEGP